MVFTQPKSLSDTVKGLGVYRPSSPAIVVHEKKLYAFWNGAGDDGIWYTKSEQGNWVPQIQVLKKDVGVAHNTSPSVVSFNGSIYAFWNTSNSQGTKYAVLTGSGWQGPVTIQDKIPNMTFFPGTSPNAVIYGGKLLLFWVGSSGDTIYFATFDGQKWSDQSNLNSKTTGLYLAQGTSPSATTFDDKLWLFWNGNDANNNPAGTFYIRYTEVDSWDASAISVRAQTSGQGSFGSKTSPEAINFGDRFLRLFWTGSAYDGTYTTTYTVPGQWAGKQKKIPVTNSGNTMPDSNVAATDYTSYEYIFWSTPNTDIHFSYDDSSV